MKFEDCRANFFQWIDPYIILRSQLGESAKIWGSAALTDNLISDRTND